MIDTSILETFRGLEFFRGIADTHLERLAAIANFVEFPAHTEMFREHEHAKNVYVIVSGRVSLVICQPKVGCRQLVEVGGGELIGWSPLVGRNRLSDTAWTLTPIKALSMEGAEVLELCEKNCDLGFQFMRRASQVLAERLSATRMQLFEMGGSQLPNVQIESD